MGMDKKTTLNTIPPPLLLDDGDCQSVIDGLSLATVGLRDRTASFMETHRWCREECIACDRNSSQTIRPQPCASELFWMRFRSSLMARHKSRKFYLLVNFPLSTPPLHLPTRQFFCIHTYLKQWNLHHIPARSTAHQGPAVRIHPRVWKFTK